MAMTEKKTLHKNHLLPIGSINEERLEDDASHQLMPVLLPSRSKNIKQHHQGKT